VARKTCFSPTIQCARGLTFLCTLVQALRLCTDRTARRGSRVIALPFLNHGTRRGWGVSVTPRLLFTPGKDPVPIVQEAGWAPGLVWTGAENLARNGITWSDLPVEISASPHFCNSENLFCVRALWSIQSWMPNSGLFWFYSCHYKIMAGCLPIVVPYQIP
jgi:hypothetical protein